VLTLRAAAEQLASVRSIDDLAPLAALFGCTGAPASFDDDTRAALGLGAAVLDARIARGPGALRALLVETRRDAPLKDLLSRMAPRLQSRTAHLLWLVLAVEHEGSAVAIAAWNGDRHPPRVASLLADRTRVVESDGETIRALASVHESVDVLTHARWVEVLGRESLSRRFYRALEKSVGNLARDASIGTDEERTEVALLTTSRLLFLAFLEAKGWLDGDHAFLTHRFDACMESGGRAHQRLLRPLFFGTLNTPVRARAPAARRLGQIPFLNGGLFSRAAVERRTRQLAFSDDAIGAIMSDVLARYRFTSREESVDFSEAAVDPEMLGRAFESLMASRDRRDTGAFYTPFSLVARVTERALERVLPKRLGDFLARRLLRNEPLDPGDSDRVRAVLAHLRVLDPACGSGAFLVYAMERVAALLGQAGDARSVAERRRAVLTRSIFGVDANRTAVWLCELRLWLSMMVESGESDPLTVAPLPNLDRNIRVGDSLLASAFAEVDTSVSGAVLARLRERYARATGARKERLARDLDRQERRRAIALLDGRLRKVNNARGELATLMRERDLFGNRRGAIGDERARSRDLRARAGALRSARRRLLDGGALPFAFATHFADAASDGGFGIVIGNPPWVRAHNIPEAQRAALRKLYQCAHAGGWERGASLANAGRGFAAQIDLAALFAERALQLLRPDGVLALLLPVKLWRSLAGGGVRQLFTSDARVLSLDDLSENEGAFDAAVYPSLLVAERQSAHDARSSAICISAAPRGQPELRWQIDARTLAFDDSPGAPWLLLPREVRESFEIVRSLGVPVAERLGRPLLGVKCGCNAAFLLRGVDTQGSAVVVMGADGRRGTVDASLLRPVLRGEGLTSWRRSPANDLILWTHGADGDPLPHLPSSAEQWLAPWRRRLQERSDARRGTRWWSVFRTESARCDRPRVVWGDVGRAPRAALVEAGDPVVPINSCYALPCDDECDALALVAWINSPLARSWLAALAEPARGGYHRYLGWTMALLPLPGDWERARMVLRPLAARAAEGRPPDDGELLEACLDAAHLRHRDVAPLLGWMLP
jgi:hypothetical protein